MKEKQFTIWSSDWYYNEKMRKAYNQDWFIENNWRECTDEEWQDEVDTYLADAYMNLSKTVDGYIMAFVIRRYWAGERVGAVKIGKELADIFCVAEDDNTYFLSEDGNVEAELSHHDGTHSVIYRVVDSEWEAEDFIDAIRSGKMSYSEFISKSRSLAPEIEDIYGYFIKNPQYDTAK